MLSALVPIMLAYNGFQGLGLIGGEIRDPQKTIPRAAILGVLAVVILYFLINVVYFRVLGLSLVANSQNVASDAAVQLAGGIAARWLTLFMMLSALGSLHGSFLTRSRVVYAMARDGQFFSALRVCVNVRCNAATGSESHSNSQFCFAYSALACFSMGMSGSASFQRAKKS